MKFMSVGKADASVDDVWLDVWRHFVFAYLKYTAICTYYCEFFKI